MKKNEWKSSTIWYKSKQKLLKKMQKIDQNSRKYVEKWVKIDLSLTKSLKSSKIS